MEPGEKRKAADTIGKDTEPSSEAFDRDSHEGSTDKRRRVIGPALPPSSAPDGVAATVDESESERSSDDDFGPVLPPQDSLQSVTRGNEVEIQREVQHGDFTVSGFSVPDSKCQREEWMLQPPSSTDWASRLDTTKIRNRKFQTGRSARGQVLSHQLDKSWTETPEQKMKRLEDEVMGVVSHDRNVQPGTAHSSKAKRAMEKNIQQYNEAQRGPSLYKVSRSSSDAAKEDDPSARRFDREKDMALGAKISAAQRREMVRKAAGFGDRFTQGSFL